MANEPPKRIWIETAKGEGYPRSTGFYAAPITNGVEYVRADLVALTVDQKCGIKEIRKRRDSVKPFRQAEAPDLYNAALADIDYLLSLLPGRTK